MNLIELTNDAISKIEIYRKPDISEWISEIDPILEAAGKSTIGTIDILTALKDGDS